MSKEITIRSVTDIWLGECTSLSDYHYSEEQKNCKKNRFLIEASLSVFYNREKFKEIVGQLYEIFDEGDIDISPSSPLIFSSENQTETVVHDISYKNSLEYQLTLYASFQQLVLFKLSFDL